MKDHEQAAASHGSGVQIAQRYLENAKAAATADEKVKHLTDALEAVLLHLRNAETEPTAAPPGFREGPI